MEAEKHGHLRHPRVPLQVDSTDVGKGILLSVLGVEDLRPDRAGLQGLKNGAKSFQMGQERVPTASAVRSQDGDIQTARLHPSPLEGVLGGDRMLQEVPLASLVQRRCRC